MSGGWLGGFAYLSLTLVTAIGALRSCLCARPGSDLSRGLRRVLGVAARKRHHRTSTTGAHYFLILGALWGSWWSPPCPCGPPRGRDLSVQSTNIFQAGRLAVVSAHINRIC